MWHTPYNILNYSDDSRNKVKQEGEIPQGLVKGLIKNNGKTKSELRLGSFLGKGILYLSINILFSISKGKGKLDLDTNSFQIVITTLK